MKRTLLYIAFALSLGNFVACDVIDEDNRYLEVENQEEPKERVQRVLIEEFTGRLCVNCPDGAAAVHDIQAYYGDRIVVVGIHAGQLAPPAAGPFAGQDFQTEAGDEYNTYFAPQANPAAMINRTLYDAALPSTKKELWMTYVISEVAKEPACEVTPTCVYDAESRTATITTEVEAWQNLPANVKLQVQIVENNIIGAQLTSAGMNAEYEHNHVLRNAANGTWGESITSLPAGEKKSYTTTTTLAEEWVAENCHAVVFVYDGATQRVLQCNECAIVAAE